MVDLNEDGWFTAGVGLGLVLAAVVFGTVLLAYGYGDHKNLITECEAELPRNEFCVLTAVKG